MSRTGIAAELIRGKKNIKRMKKEIDTVIKTIRGFVSSLEFSGPAQCWNRSFKAPTCTWEVVFYRNLRKFYVTAWVPTDEGKGSGMAYCGRKKWNGQYIQDAHQALDEFIEGMIREFPLLEPKLAHFRRAAKKQF